ncbi:hypothetical protein KSP40_PGU020006 [Platanthera guangdongensis]|uniref:Uncharacterized protein n=1 Tax=Platanthera guangdongensis TaxID=2320717 RepID=A0ABR2N015_9ASPA
MGVCFSKKGGEASSSPTKVPPDDLSKEKSAAKEEKKKLEVTEKRLPSPIFANVAPSSTARKASCVGEEKEEKKTEISVKKYPQFEEERGSKALVNIEIPGEQLPAQLRTSSCTKEEVDAILIQCGRLSRSSSGKASKETIGGIGPNRRYSGSKRSYDFDDERMREEEPDKPVPRPSPRRRTPNRERSGSRERRVSRSPGRRSEGVFTAPVSDKQNQQPAKMVSVPPREKGAPLVNGETGGGNFCTKKVTASPRSRSPANTARISSENPQPQSLSRNSSRKTDQSPFRRSPLAEMEDNSLKNQNGSTTSTFQKSRAMNDGVKKPQPQKEKHDTMKAVNQVMDEKTANNREESINNPITVTRTRSSRRSSRDLDNNPAMNPTASYASFLLEDIQTQQQLQKQNTAFSLPACISKACSILDAVADLNSACSNRRSYEAEKCSTNISGNGGGFMGRGLLTRREQSIELEVKDDLMEPCLHKYVTVRQMGRETDPVESAGSNSVEGLPWTSSLWDMNSVDSACGTSLTGNWKDVEVEDEVGDEGNQQQRSSWRRSGAATGRKSPTGKKREFDRRQVQQGGGFGVGGGKGRVGGNAFSLPVSAATF